MFVLHNGPLADTAANLGTVLDACAESPATRDSPKGWLVMATHVDDGFGCASNWIMVDYVNGIINNWYACKVCCPSSK